MNETTERTALRRGNRIFQGFESGVQCAFYKAYFHLLFPVFGFRPWHARAPYACREYKRRTVALASSLEPGVVVEIGCGLGEIVSRVPANERVGFDIDAGAIAAARYLFGRKSTFRIASLFEPDQIRAGMLDAKIDVLIAVNFLHATSIDRVCQAVRALTLRVPIRFLLIDTLRVGAMKAAFHSHTIEDIGRLGKIRTTVDGGDGARDLHVIEPRLEWQAHAFTTSAGA